MEVGKPRDPSVVTGWLGRHLASVPPMRTDAPLRALGFSSGLQKTLVGAPKTLPISDPATFGIVRHHRDAHRAHELAQERIRAVAGAAALVGARRAQHARAAAPHQLHRVRARERRRLPEHRLRRALRSAAALIKADVGIEAAQIDVGGWDTHSAQDPLNAGGAMYNNMQTLSNALGAFHADVIAGTQTTNVTVVVISEFGRNVRENSARGTDHGRGNCMFVMGRNIAGGRVYAFNWPGPRAREPAGRPGPQGHARPPRHPRRDREESARESEYRHRVPGLCPDVPRGDEVEGCGRSGSCQPEDSVPRRSRNRTTVRRPVTESP